MTPIQKEVPPDVMKDILDKAAGIPRRTFFAWKYPGGSLCRDCVKDKVRYPLLVRISHRYDVYGEIVEVEDK